MSSILQVMNFVTVKMSLKPFNPDDDPFYSPGKEYQGSKLSNSPANFVGEIGALFLKYIIHPFSVFTPPFFLGGILIWLVFNAFKVSFDYGVRSTSAVIFPLVIMAFFFAASIEFWRKLGKQNIFLIFFLSMFWGFGILGFIHIAKLLGILSWVPITEVVLSGSFSLLVYGHVANGNRVIPYYYGVIAGFLLYVIIFGLP
jgi:hypothetical protein